MKKIRRSHKIISVLVLTALSVAPVLAAEEEKTSEAPSLATKASLALPKKTRLGTAFIRLSKCTGVPIMVEELYVPERTLTRLKVEELAFTNATVSVIMDHLKVATKDAFSYEMRNGIINVRAAALTGESPLDTKVQDFEQDSTLMHLLEKIFSLESRFSPTYAQDNGGPSLSKRTGKAIVAEGQIRDVLNIFCDSANLRWQAMTVTDGTTLLLFREKVRPEEEKEEAEPASTPSNHSHIDVDTGG